ncbi:MAG: LamB/YcsF family protein, partial [Oscillospiraceae bacterium]|nr:LamB/YcsF family protein [Oscillospiraceae bacterium]
MSTSIDLNADLGESFGVYRYGADEELIPLVSSV